QDASAWEERWIHLRVVPAARPQQGDVEGMCVSLVVRAVGEADRDVVEPPERERVAREPGALEVVGDLGLRLSRVAEGRISARRGVIGEDAFPREEGALARL